MTPLPAALLERLTATYEANADATRAVAMCAYMRGQFEFLGIATPARRALDREIVAGLPAPTEAQLRNVAVACFALEPREYQYFACDYYLPALGAPRQAARAPLAAPQGTCGADARFGACRSPV